MQLFKYFFKYLRSPYKTVKTEFYIHIIASLQTIFIVDFIKKNRSRMVTIKSKIRKKKFKAFPVVISKKKTHSTVIEMCT